jgi:hypothetical protein
VSCFFAVFVAEGDADYRRVLPSVEASGSSFGIASF